MREKYPSMNTFMFNAIIERLKILISPTKGVYFIDKKLVLKTKGYSLKIGFFNISENQFTTDSLKDFDLFFTKFEDILLTKSEIMFDDRVIISLGKTFNLKLFNDLKEFLNGYASKKSGLRFVLPITKENALYVDDFLLLFSNYETAKIYYDLDSDISVKDLTEELYFHILMFFEGLKKKLNKDFNEFYRLDNIVKRLIRARKKAISLPITSIGMKPDFLDIGNYIVGAIYSKLFKERKTLKSDDANKSVDVVPSEWNNVLIIGWYGTETQGDKAILGEVLYFLKKENKNIKITISTIYPLLSQQTNHELADLEGVQIKHIKKCADPSFLSEFDAIVIGGGPLMESSSMRHLANVFVLANKLSIPRIVFGCGVGPIHSKKVEQYTKTILKYASAGFLRDNESKELADTIHENTLGVACDPAMGFMIRWRRTNQKKMSSNGIACLLRANTNEFVNQLSKPALLELNQNKAQTLTAGLSNLFELIPEPINLLHMNAPWIGGDDRIFNRKIVLGFNRQVNYNLIRDYLTLEQHIEAINENRLALVMRYHGHIFSIGLAIPFVSLDYTGKKGKVSSLVTRLGLNHLSINWSETEDDLLLEKFEYLERNYSEIHTKLLHEGDRFYELLHEVYRKNLNAIKF